MRTVKGLIGIARNFMGISRHSATVRSYPVWNDSRHLENIWQEAKLAGPERRLGTVLEALRTLSEYELVFQDKMEHVTTASLRKRVCVDTDSLRVQLNTLFPWYAVGDTRNVSHLYCNKLPVGYVIETDSQSGLQKEVIEGLTRKVTVLRRYREIIVAYPTVKTFTHPYLPSSANDRSMFMGNCPCPLARNIFYGDYSDRLSCLSFICSVAWRSTFV